MKWSHVNHRSGKVYQLKTDVLTTEPRHHCCSCARVKMVETRKLMKKLRKKMQILNYGFS